MADTVNEHEQRSREIGDVTRRYLTALNTGGVATTFAVASTLAGAGIDPRWAVRPVAVFVSGLGITGASLLLAKHKALKRRNAAKKHVEPPNFQRWYWANFTYEMASLTAFVVAMCVGLWALDRVHLPPQ
jgi:hypothetical protein